ncbi:hypothetical protein BDW02DRAFT_505288 [Decorospora gaudefroyi]|uniref:Large ribosomal subunit protein mL67 n=1 Tax=Decorospora gaudefroyi TaxID=184978 RepID=A0A6A5K8W8_9PLEO|nr:hypothetical protein BDW02DRAFT_505288 [Decorospora gaudefroyi]
MPRSLARLRFRPPAKQVSLSLAETLRPSVLLNRIEAHVERQSRPQHIKLQTVVDPRARRQPTGQYIPAPQKPSTLRDVVDPHRRAQHGDTIYIFRHIRTNQIIYSLQELLDKHHLDQLPFMGKHSKPPVLRPDEWVPHCVVTFPTPTQGHHAFRQLREFRKLHETAWNRTNPGWKRLNRKVRMRKIMDQRANTSADLAKVLSIQHELGEKTMEEHQRLDKQTSQYLDKRWERIDALAKAALLKQKPADSIPWLEGQVRSVDLKLKMKHNQKPDAQKRLKEVKKSLEVRLRRMQSAIRKADQLKSLQEEIGAEKNLEDLKAQAPAHYNHHIARSLLPPKLKQERMKPFTLEGVSVKWVDVQDAVCAAPQWPELIEHESLDINKARPAIMLLSAEEYKIEKQKDVQRMLEALEPKEPEPKEPEPKSGVAKFLPKLNPFRRANA